MDDNGIYDLLEEKVHEYILDAAGDSIQVGKLPTADDITDMVAHIAERLDKYPAVFTYIAGATETALDSSFLAGQDDVELDLYVAISYQGQDDQMHQRKLAEQWCLYLRKVLTGKKLVTDKTAGGLIGDYSMTPMFNVSGGFALYRVELTLNDLVIDFEQIEKP